MSDPKKYTVGWICALSIELSAARAFLEVNHDKPSMVAEHDTNSYALGMIGGHNVVIAVLPDGETGIASAAVVARNMLHSFPNVRLGLMVGIGGGAPTLNNDVRLGDVVVSRRYGGRGGVFQYDFGKAIQNQDVPFEHTDFLDQPPTVLRTAVNALKSRYQTSGHTLRTKIDDALEKWPELRKGFSRPSPISDRLYKSSVVHLSSPGTCASLCGVDAHQLVRRSVRENKDGPAIHYGLIASANQVMKNSAIRDKAAENHGVLCFEMEAAGLMNHFPCLVVRGISDYSDSHKNDEWRKYAAMVAAAYASDLLYEVEVTQVEAEDFLVDVIRRVHRGIEWIGPEVKTIKTMILEERKARQLDRIIHWLSPSDPASNLERALALWQPKTGSWILESTLLNRWKTGGIRHLWLHGLSGSGKTILSATLVNHLTLLNTHPTLMFFFDFSDPGKTTLNGLLKSLVWQLFDICGDEGGYLARLFESSANGSKKPNNRCLWDCLVSMTREIGRVNIVIDALDECTTRDELVPWIEGVAARPSLPEIHLILAGRPEYAFINWIPPAFGADHCMALEEEAINQDILSYVNTRLDGDRKFVMHQISQGLREEICDKVGRRAKGMFRWAACQMDALADKCHSYELIREALGDLPKSLEETYHRILKGMSKTGKRILQFLVHVEQRMTLLAAKDILVTQIDTQPWTFKKSGRVHHGMDILDWCSSLISISTVSRHSRLSHPRDEMGEVQLAHFSVKEYLLRQENFKAETAGIPLTKTSLTYFSHMCEFPASERTELRFPLGEHTVHILANVSRFADHEEEVFKPLEALLVDEDAMSYLNLVAFAEMEYSQPSALYFACHAGLLNVARDLIEKRIDFNVSSATNTGLLCAAAARGHASVAKLLLENGFNVDAEDESGESPLYQASARGHKAVVQVLLEYGAEVGSWASNDSNALAIARYNGHVEVVKLLLDNGAQGLFEEWENSWMVKSTILSVAENDAVARTMLEMGIYAAAERGDEEEVTKLLCWDGEIELQEDWHYRAIQIARKKGHKEVVRYLQGERLYQAAENGEYEIAKALLDEGASPDGSNICGDTALEAAGTNAKLEIVELLLSRNASVVNGYSGSSSLVGFFERCKWSVDQKILHLLRDHEDRELAQLRSGDWRCGIRR